MVLKCSHLWLIFLLSMQMLLSSCTFQDVKTSDIPLNTVNQDIRIGDFNNKLILLSFGYTHCPDICPATLMHVAQALDLMSKEERASLQAIFVSVDPERDTPTYLAEYTGFFHPDIIGATATSENLKAFMKAFKIEAFKKADIKNYEISHTSYLFLIDENATVLDMMGHQTKPESIVEAIRNKLKRTI